MSRIKGTPAAILGRIEAPDAESAVKEWIEKFEITDPEAPFARQRLRTHGLY
jgi:hypothetical protein